MVTRLQSVAVILTVALAPLAHAATTVTAVHASNTGAATKSFDAGSKPFRDLLDPLSYDTFKTTSQKTVALARSGETRVTVNTRYTLSFSNTEVRSDGHVKSTVKVFGLPRNAREPVEVLELTVHLAPDKPVMIRGLRMDEGEIIVFLNLD